MKTQKLLRRPYKVLCFLWVVVMGLWACHKENPEEYHYQYVTDYEQVNTLVKSTIGNLYALGAIQEPTLLNLTESIQSSVTIYKISYTTTFQGYSKIASGLLCIPTEQGTYPLICFQNGTNTSHAQAPTQSYSNATFTLITSLAGQGYILLIPDYFGFGSASDVVHPFLEKESSNRSILDMIRATREFLDHYEGEATYSNKLYLMGYSQGGWATACLLEALEKENTTGFEVKAASCGAGAYNLESVAAYMLSRDSLPSPLYLPYLVYSHQKYGTLTGNLNTYFMEPFASRIPQLFDGSLSNTEVNDQLTHRVSDLLTAQFIDQFETDTTFNSLKVELAANSLYAFTTRAAVHLYHGDHDENVPFSESEQLYRGFLELNPSVRPELLPLSGLNHSTGVTPWGVATLLWFNSMQ